MSRTEPTWTTLDRDNLILQTRFGHRYGHRLARFYRRAALILRWTQFVAGGGAALTVFGGMPSVIQALGAVVALTAAVDIAWDPSDKAALCERNAERWGDLDAKAGALSDEDFSRDMIALTAIKAPTVDALIVPVFNDLLKTFGREDALQPESWWQRKVVRLLM